MREDVNIGGGGWRWWWNWTAMTSLLLFDDDECVKELFRWWMLAHDRLN